MAQFTQLNLQAKTEPKTLDAARHKGLKSSRTIITIGSLMLASTIGIFLLGANGCSKGTSKPAVADSGNQNLQNSSPQVPAISVSLPTAPVASRPAAPKKIGKKRPSTVTYTDKTYGVSFRYPRKYSLKTGDKLDAKSSVAMNFVQPGGIALATVEMPGNSYPGTDFSSALFNLSVHKSLSADQCTHFAFPKSEHPDSEPGSPSQVKVGETEFNQVEDFGPMKSADAKYYHVFENGACYEFAMAVGTSGDKVDDQSKPVDRNEVFGKLEKILVTVKVKPMAEPQVAAGPTVQSTEAPAVK
ncbi:MAG: hypothetical protein DMG69_18230 [Acidobacteria bacterium]|nr:MAG: hypothetical protein DMG69_18230 [Acidobacteriota bacterium]